MQESPNKKHYKQPINLESDRKEVKKEMNEDREVASQREGNWKERLMMFFLGTPSLGLKEIGSMQMKIMFSIYSCVLIGEILGRNIIVFLEQRHISNKKNISRTNISEIEVQTTFFALLVTVLASMINTYLWIKIRSRVCSSLFYFIHCGLIYSIDVNECNLGQTISNLLCLNQFINLISVSVYLSNSPLHSLLTMGLAFHKFFYSGAIKIPDEEVMGTLFTVSMDVILFVVLACMFSSGYCQIQFGF